MWLCLLEGTKDNRNIMLPPGSARQWTVIRNIFKNAKASQRETDRTQIMEAPFRCDTLKLTMVFQSGKKQTRWSWIRELPSKPRRWKDFIAKHLHVTRRDWRQPVMELGKAMTFPELVNNNMEGINKDRHQYSNRIHFREKLSEVIQHFLGGLKIKIVKFTIQAVLFNHPLLGQILED